MTKEELEKLEIEYKKLLEDKEFWQNRRQAIRRLSSNGLIPKYKGFWFWKRCPICKKKLSRIQSQTWDELTYPDGFYLFFYYWCSCGWEYAK
jgi:hypothetical protein